MASLHSEEDCRWKQLLLAKDKKEKEEEEDKNLEIAFRLG